MARKPTVPEPKPANLSPQQVAAAVPLIERRITDLKQLNLRTLTEENGDNTLRSMVQKINATLREILGANTIEYNEYQIESLSAMPWIFGGDVDLSYRARLPDIEGAVRSAVSSLETLRDIFKERLAPDNSIGPNRVLRAYEGLDLHPEIARAASALYRDGHYANAVEAAVKALNGLVTV